MEIVGSVVAAIIIVIALILIICYAGKEDKNILPAKLEGDPVKIQELEIFTDITPPDEGMEWIKETVDGNHYRFVQVPVDRLVEPGNIDSKIKPCFYDLMIYNWGSFWNRSMAYGDHKKYEPCNCTQQLTRNVWEKYYDIQALPKSPHKSLDCRCGTCHFWLKGHYEKKAALRDKFSLDADRSLSWGGRFL